MWFRVCVCLVNTDFLLPLVLSFRVNVSLGFALMWVFLCVVRSRDKSSTPSAWIAEMLTVNRYGVVLMLAVRTWAKMPNSKSSAAQPTNGFSLETGHHLRVNKQAFQQHKIYCQEALYNKETHVFLLFVQGKFISYRFLKCSLLKTNQKMIPELILFGTLAFALVLHISLCLWELTVVTYHVWIKLSLMLGFHYFYMLVKIFPVLQKSRWACKNGHSSVTF